MIIGVLLLSFRDLSRESNRYVGLPTTRGLRGANLGHGNQSARAVWSLALESTGLAGGALGLFSKRQRTIRCLDLQIRLNIPHRPSTEELTMQDFDAELKRRVPVVGKQSQEK